MHPLLIDIYLERFCQVVANIDNPANIWRHSLGLCKAENVAGYWSLLKENARGPTQSPRMKLH